MNRYGAKARDHWKKWLPQRYGEIDNPDSFFEELGGEIQDRVQALAQALAGEDLAGESFLDKLGRLQMARVNAESQALRELALLEPEEPEKTEER